MMVRFPAVEQCEANTLRNEVENSGECADFAHFRRSETRRTKEQVVIKTGFDHLRISDVDEVPQLPCFNAIATRQPMRPADRCDKVILEQGQSCDALMLVERAGESDVEFA